LVTVPRLSGRFFQTLRILRKERLEFDDPETHAEEPIARVGGHQVSMLLSAKTADVSTSQGIRTNWKKGLVLELVTKHSNSRPFLPGGLYIVGEDRVDRWSHRRCDRGHAQYEVERGTERMMRAGICARVRTPDQSGKVFRVEQGMRRCMVCEELFTRETAAEHANAACRPEKQSGSQYGCEAQTSN